MAELSQTFRTTLFAAGGNNVAIVVPPRSSQAFERGKRVPVVVTIDDGYSYRNTIATMGGQFLLSFNAETRRATGRGRRRMMFASTSMTRRGWSRYPTTSPSPWPMTSPHERRGSD